MRDFDPNIGLSLSTPWSTAAVSPAADGSSRRFDELEEFQGQDESRAVHHHRSSLDRELSAQLGLGCASPAPLFGAWDTSTDVGDCSMPLSASRGSNGSDADDSGIWLASTPACAGHTSPSPASRRATGKLAAQSVGRDVAPLPRSPRPSISAPCCCCTSDALRGELASGAAGRGRRRGVTSACGRGCQPNAAVVRIAAVGAAAGTERHRAFAHVPRAEERSRARAAETELDAQLAVEVWTKSFGVG